ncbi:MAG: PIN domain-containing protein [Microbacterium sp.]|uniref:type II toxin-antitoxin system VapC family toxin n=1 Tax=Microbacterium sp. TaxID=51671 RepID=UPI0039E3C25D
MTAKIAFDADVLIYAAAADHPLGARVAPLLASPDLERVGSVLLLTEVLAKPMRDDADSAETSALLGVLSRIELHPFDDATARLSLVLAISYGLRAADAAHLATAVAAGAEQFVTNNRRDFPLAITEIDIVYPDQLPAE